MELFNYSKMTSISAFEKFCQEAKIGPFKKEAGETTSFILPFLSKLKSPTLFDYLKLSGYVSFVSTLKKKAREALISEITSSGLRGRGGAGFPVGQKWIRVSKAKSNKKYILAMCSKDTNESRILITLLERAPHLIIEAMLFCAYATEATNGIIFINDKEEAKAIEATRKAISESMTFGLLGEEILGEKFHFDIEIKLGNAQRLLSEETACIGQIEGKSFFYPKQRPPHPSSVGLFSLPTLVHDLETLAYIPFIISLGYKAFSSIGARFAPGPKLIELKGDISNPGTYEVLLGTSIEDIVSQYGGISSRESIQGAWIGGSFGSFLGVEDFSTPYSYEDLKKKDIYMGSGEIFVLDSHTFLLDFLLSHINKSCSSICSKCPPCRIGVNQMRLLIEDLISYGENEKNINLILNLAKTLKETLLCKLGYCSYNAVISVVSRLMNSNKRNSHAY